MDNQENKCHLPPFISVQDCSLKRYYKVVLVCHNKKEVFQAKQLKLDVDIFYSNNFIDYIKFYSNAKAGIVNRVHGGFIMAAYGIPSIVIGSDSRAKMTEMLNLPNYFVEDISLEQIMEKFCLTPANDIY